MNPIVTKIRREVLSGAGIKEALNLVFKALRDNVYLREQDMKVFLTGATGYVGAAVAAKLQAAGHTVVGVARNEAGAATLRNRNVEPYLGDLKAPQGLIQGVQAADGVIHTAFIHDFSDFEGAVAVERNVIKAFVEALAGSGKPLITMSATAVLGDTGDRIVDETAPTNAEAIRAKAEQDVVNAASQSIRSVALRLAPFVYGYGGSSFIPMLIKEGRETGIVRYVEAGANKVSAVHVDNAAQLYVLALERATAGSIFHVASQSGITVRAMAEAISRTVGCRTQSITMAEATAAWGPTLVQPGRSKPAATKGVITGVNLE